MSNSTVPLTKWGRENFALPTSCEYCGGEVNADGAAAVDHQRVDVLDFIHRLALFCCDSPLACVTILVRIAKPTATYDEIAKHLSVRVRRHMTRAAVYKRMCTAAEIMPDLAAILTPRSRAPTRERGVFYP